MKFVVEPEVPMKAIWYWPAAKLVPLITRGPFAGNVLTDAGVTLQLFVPTVVAQLRLTVPVNPSCEEMVIGRLVPVEPAFPAGQALGSLGPKSRWCVVASCTQCVS